ncbi:MAG: tripartite tricarboxylate transporter substrate binding protein [Pseudomonadota bacterium]
MTKKTEAAVSRKRLLLAAILAFTGIGLVSPATAQTPAWPTAKPIRFVVSAAAGSAPDVVTRFISERLRVRLGQTIVVENHGGAGGTIAHELVARAAPDGYTMLMSFTGALTVSPHLYKKLSYDAVRDLAPVIITTSLPNVVLTSTKLPVNSVQELIAHIKRNPGKLNYASSSNGTSSHLIMELLKSRTGTHVVHIPFSAATGALTSLIGGETDIYVGLPTPNVNQMVAAGKIRMLAVTSSQRFSLLPQVPTLTESGISGVEALAWNGVVVPARTPKDIVDRLNREINAVLQMPEVRDQFRAQGIEPTGGTPEDFAALIRAENDKWAPIIKRIGLSLD